MFIIENYTRAVIFCAVTIGSRGTEGRPFLVDLRQANGGTDGLFYRPSATGSTFKVPPETT